MPTFEFRDSGDHELPLFEVRSGSLAAVFLPTVGGRLLSLRVGGHELLWVNPKLFDSDLRVVVPRAEWPEIDGSFASWTNVGGSKTWPAPQGWDGPAQWPGPPDAVLDSGNWTISTSQSVDRLTVKMTSPADLRTGLQVTRSFEFLEHATGMNQTITFRNITDRSVRWSMWEVVQTNTAPSDGVLGVVEVELATDSLPLDLGRYVGAPMVHVEDGTARFHIVSGVAKFGFPAAAGTVRWCDPSGRTLELAAAIDESAEYPDGGSRVELWTQSPVAEPISGLSGLHPDAWLVELELLSPLVTIEPDEEAQFSIDWRVGGE